MMDYAEVTPLQAEVAVLVDVLAEECANLDERIVKQRADFAQMERAYKAELSKNEKTLEDLKRRMSVLQRHLSNGGSLSLEALPCAMLRGGK